MTASIVFHGFVKANEDTLERTALRAVRSVNDRQGIHLMLTPTGCELNSATKQNNIAIAAERQYMIANFPLRFVRWRPKT